MPGDTTDTDRVPTMIKHKDAKNCFIKNEDSALIANLLQ